ncbi:MAG: PAAR-like domain-containing protein [Myxococcota bacterium]
MFPIATNKAGMCQAFPDTCKTPAPPGPPVPIPYPNIANMNQANAGTCSAKVLIEMKNTVTKQTEIPMSSGDEAGSAGGVVSGKIKGEATFTKKFSMKVKAEGQNVIFHTCVCGQNGKSANMPSGTHVQPSQAKVKVMS